MGLVCDLIGRKAKQNDKKDPSIKCKLCSKFQDKKDLIYKEIFSISNIKYDIFLLT